MLMQNKFCINLLPYDSMCLILLLVLMFAVKMILTFECMDHQWAVGEKQTI